MATLTILNPVASASGGSNHAQRLSSLAGTTIAVTGNGWHSWAAVRDLISHRLREDFGVAEVVHYDVPLGGRAPEDTLTAIAQADAAVIGLANCGSCAVATAQNATWLADMGVPLAVAVTERYVELVSSLNPSAPPIVLPAALEQLGSGEIDSVAASLPQRLSTALVEQ